MAGRRVAAAVRLRRPAHPLKDKVTETQAWGDIPTCKEAGSTSSI